MNPLENIRIVCVRPLFGGNMGAICRAMQNCGLDQLVLVNPSPDMDPVELRKMALKALPVYKNRKEANSVEEAVADCGAVAMTSGVDGFYRDHASTPREAVPELLDIASQKPVAIVFGSEDKGMTTRELKFATHLLRIPSAAAYSSLNLSQAVMVVAHELYQAAGEFSPGEEKTPPADHRFMERMFECWDEAMRDIQFCQEEKREHMMLGLRRVLTRGRLTENDVKIMMGLARQASWASKNLPPPPENQP